ncbi:hypothetical protein M8818_003909 [Zalaria obscura]|uniref:Uncharacterized protein n=1 Tax=Zalaria obscura TaxID=2024903 RepID=A0ACC3SD04_9PEZI
MDAVKDNLNAGDSVTLSGPEAARGPSPTMHCPPRHLMPQLVRPQPQIAEGWKRRVTRVQYPIGITVLPRARLVGHGPWGGTSIQSGTEKSIATRPSRPCRDDGEASG